jgi:hypothetical protein
LKQDYLEKMNSEDMFDLMVEIARKAEKAVNPEIFEDEGSG